MTPGVHAVHVAAFPAAICICIYTDNQVLPGMD